MTGLEDQILACLRRPDCSAATDVARRIGVSPEFVQPVMDRLAKEECLVGTDGGGYALSPKGKRRVERHRHLEAWRKPLVRW